MNQSVRIVARAPANAPAPSTHVLVREYHGTARSVD